jgi:hypothetical protein
MLTMPVGYSHVQDWMSDNWADSNLPRLKMKRNIAYW